MAERDGTTRPNGTHTDTRRRFLTVVGAGAASGLAGCSSGGGGDDGADATTTETAASGAANTNEDGEGSGESGPTETASDSGGGGGDSGENGGGVSESAADPYADPCPSPPFSYSQHTYEAPNDPAASFSMDAPDFPEIVTSGGIGFRFGSADSTTSVNVSFNDLGESVSDILESSAEAYAETTDEFDLRPSGARAFTQEPTGVWQTKVTWPVEEGVAAVLVSLRTDQGEFACSEAAGAIRTRVVESIRPV